jgi:hypothetical protein
MPQNTDRADPGYDDEEIKKLRAVGHEVHRFVCPSCGSRRYLPLFQDADDTQAVVGSFVEQYRQFGCDHERS